MMVVLEGEKYQVTVEPEPCYATGDFLPVAARGQGVPGQMTWLKGFRPGCLEGLAPPLLSTRII